MDREFERFRGGPNEPLSKRVYVTISKNNAIVFNQNAFQLMGRPEAVFLNYSRKRDIIAMEPTSPRFNDSFPVVKNGAGFRVNAAPFCQHFNITIDQTIKFITPEFTEGALHLTLGATINIKRKRRRKNER